MKTISLIAIWLATLSASAANVTIAWDASPVITVTNYTIRWQLAGSTNQLSRKVGPVLITTLTNLAPGQWTATVTATSAQGIESDPSLPLSFDVPAPPTIRLNLQGSSSIDGPWEDIYAVSVPVISGVQFYRGKLEIEQ